jgi:hypothetical protein
VRGPEPANDRAELYERDVVLGVVIIDQDDNPRGPRIHLSIVPPGGR